MGLRLGPWPILALVFSRCISRSNLKSSFLLSVLLGRSSGSRGRLEVPGRRLDAGGQTKGQVRGLLQEEADRRQGPRRSQEGPQGGQASRQVPEDHRKLRIRINHHILLFVDQRFKSLSCLLMSK